MYKKYEPDPNVSLFLTFLSPLVPSLGARIAEYSQLYDQVMFREAPGQTTPAPHHSHPGLPSSPSMPETCLEEDWLHSTYSNGELASFISSSLTEMGDARASSTPQCRLPSVASSPSLKTTSSSQSTPQSQRWSSCVSAPTEKEEHVYSTIKRHPSFSAPSLPAKTTSQSLSSVEQQEKKSEIKFNGVNCFTDRLHGPSLGRTGRQSSLPERSDLTLHDGQQVVVLNRASALSVLAATQNYLANFKDNGEDDDDYVEIRSEDESEQDRNSSSGVLQNQSRGLLQSQSLPCSPVHSYDPLRSLDHHHLEKYLWSEPQQSQPKIVQSIREKFQCLSSSSFA